MLKTASFRVIGDPRMHCQSCEQRVIRVLKSLMGIQHVSANAASQRIEVLFDPAKLEESAIVARLDLLGYTTETMRSAARSKE